MAVLSESDRVSVWAEDMRDISNIREVCAINKIDLRAAVNATDDWVDANQAAFNAALPLAARNGLTTSQKARLLTYVVAKRFLMGV